MNEIIIAIIGALGVVSASFVGVYATRRQRNQKEQAELEMDLQRQALDFTGFISEWSGVYETIEDLMQTTEIDRFLILRAWNGKFDPKWTTAIYQMRKGDQKPMQYIHFELDTDYVDRLNKMIRHGQMVMHTEEAEEGAIKQVYQAEGVTASVWCHIQNLAGKGRDSESKSITYCSFATHAEEGLSDKTVTKCRVVTNHLKGLASDLTNKRP